MRIVKAEPSHIDQIRRIWNQFAEYHQKIDAYYGTVKDSDILFGDYLLQRMDDKDSMVLAAVEDGEMIGYCLAYVQQRPPVFTERMVGILSDLAVDETHRGAGAGGALLEAAMQWLRERGAKRVELRTSARNGAAIEFYSGHGFWVYDHMMTREL
jgi:GNAT superfamily N-acetyltransferase